MTITPAEEFYRVTLVNTQQNLFALKKKINWISTIRLLWVILFFFSLYLLWGSASYLILTAIALGVIPFLFLIKYHNELFICRNFLEAKIKVCQREQNLQQYNFENLEDGKQWADTTHDYSYDLDIFGKKSLFAYLNRSASWMGEKYLATLLQKPLRDAHEIIRRQDAVRELSAFASLRLDFMAQGMTLTANHGDAFSIHKIVDLSLFVASSIVRFLILAIPFIFLILVILWAFSIISGMVISYLFIVCFITSLLAAKIISRRQQVLNNGLQSLRIYGNLIPFIEQNEFQSDELKELKSKLFVDGLSVSRRIKQLSHHLENLDQRFNAVGGAILNGFMLWDFRHLIFIDKWLAQNATSLEMWLNALSHFDALASMATFAHNHPHYNYPVPNDNDQPVLAAREMGHPLIPRERCVCNDVNLSSRPSFLVVTGANMAGKSTYLRTIGVNYILASMGMPVFALEMQFTPATLFTSLRTTDSLSDQESYFFAELKRLQQIIVRLRNGEKMFVILDEILKGTNSVDKQTGSLALVEQLVSLEAAGVIATHDLKLGELATHYPQKIFNHRFEAHIQDDELSFSYKLQSGIAQNMNACFLMKKMGIIPQ